MYHPGKIKTNCLWIESCTKVVGQQEDNDATSLSEGLKREVDAR